MHSILPDDVYIGLRLGYGLFILLICFTIFRNIKKNKKFSFIDFFNLYYAISYGVTPFFCLENFENKALTRHLKTNDSSYLVRVFLLSLVVFFTVNISYRFVIRRAQAKKQYSPRRHLDTSRAAIIDVGSEKFLILNIGLVVFTWICLILWTRQFGSVFGAFEYASAMRGGLHIENPFSFLFRFCGLFIMTTYGLFFFLKSNIKRKTPATAVAIITFLASVFGLFIHFINNDSRSAIMYFLLSLVLMIFGDKIARLKLKNFLVGAIIFVCSLSLISNLDHITKFIQSGGDASHFDNSGREEVNFFVKEFFHIYTNNIGVLYMKDNPGVYNLEPRLLENLVEIPYAWLPETFKPSSITNMNSYNTSFYANAAGTLPADLLTGSILTLGFPGLIIVPIFYAFIMALLDWHLGLKSQNKLPAFAYMIKCYLLWSLTLDFVTYIDLAPILLSFFALFVYIIIMRISYHGRRQAHVTAGLDGII